MLLICPRFSLYKPVGDQYSFKKQSTKALCKTLLKLGTGHYLCGGRGERGRNHGGGPRPNFFKDKGWAKRKFHYDWGWVIV